MKAGAGVDDSKVVMSAQRLFSVKGFDAERATRDVRRLELGGEVVVRPGACAWALAPARRWLSRAPSVLRSACLCACVAGSGV